MRMRKRESLIKEGELFGFMLITTVRCFVFFFFFGFLLFFLFIFLNVFPFLKQHLKKIIIILYFYFIRKITEFFFF